MSIRLNTGSALSLGNIVERFSKAERRWRTLVRSRALATARRGGQVPATDWGSSSGSVFSATDLVSEEVGVLGDWPGEREPLCVEEGEAVDGGGLAIIPVPVAAESMAKWVGIGTEDSEDIEMLAWQDRGVTLSNCELHSPPAELRWTFRSVSGHAVSELLLVEPGKESFWYEEDERFWLIRKGLEGRLAWPKGQLNSGLSSSGVSRLSDDVSRLHCVSKGPRCRSRGRNISSIFASPACTHSKMIYSGSYLFVFLAHPLALWWQTESEIRSPSDFSSVRASLGRHGEC